MDLNSLKALFYFPLDNGKYEVVPGLKNFGFSGSEDHRKSLLFQLDQEFPVYCLSKQKARNENLEKYYPNNKDYLSRSELFVVCDFILKKLLSEWPHFFELTQTAHGKRFFCKLTETEILIDPSTEVAPPYRDLFDALAMQVQEDMAIWKWDIENAKDHLAAIHLCYPNHWSAEEKIGKSFVKVHEPVAEIESINKNYVGMLRAMVQKGPFERFAWGLATDKRLNHHPFPDPRQDASLWKGRSFDLANPELYLRVERQSLHPFPTQGLSLFTIRTYFYDAKILNHSQIKNLISAIDSMTEKSLRYKGLSESKEDVKKYLFRLSERFSENAC